MLASRNKCSVSLRNEIDMPPTVFQIVPHFSYADAVGNQIIATRDLLIEQGCETQIFADNWDPRLNAVTRPTSDYLEVAGKEHWLILHYCICGYANHVARDTRGHLVTYYHNVTPARFYYGYEPLTATCCAQARAGLKQLVGRGSAIAASDYNREELRSMGFDVRAVAPYIMKIAGLRAGLATDTSADIRARFEAHDLKTWLYVGRIAPNKRIEDIVGAFAYYHRHIEPRSRLLLVGSRREDKYNGEVVDLIQRLGVEDAVIFPGLFPSESLGVFYELADLYISLSEHEGFCVPLIEAMSFGLPILAFDSTAVPSTLAGSGVLLHRKDAPLVAEVAHEVLTNQPLREAIVAKQRQRLADFEPEAMRRQLQTALIAAGIPLNASTM